MKSYIYSTHAIRVSRKNIAKACESICFVFCEDIVLYNTCKYWFRWFKTDDFDVSDRRSGISRKLETD